MASFLDRIRDYADYTNPDNFEKRYKDATGEGLSPVSSSVKPSKPNMLGTANTVVPSAGTRPAISSQPAATVATPAAPAFDAAKATANVWQRQEPQYSSEMERNKADLLKYNPTPFDKMTPQQRRYFISDAKRLGLEDWAQSQFPPSEPVMVAPSRRPAPVRLGY